MRRYPIVTPKREMIQRLCKIMGWKDWFRIYTGELMSKKRVTQLVKRLELQTNRGGGE